MTRRVVITGMGTITTLGCSPDELHTAMTAGRSGVGYWRSLDMTNVDCKVGGDLGDFDFKSALEALKGRITDARWSKLKKMFRSCSFANKMTVLTAVEAFLDAGLDPDKIDPYRTSAIVAGHDFNHKYVLSNNLRFREDSLNVDILAGVEALDSNIAATVSEALGVLGPVHTVGGACASGNLALRDAYRDITLGECDHAAVAAPPFDITAPDIYAMTMFNAVVTEPSLQDPPSIASRPFDVRRDGFVAAHGAGTLILEELEIARRRGAEIYGELLAVRAGGEANRLPSPNSAGQARLIGETIRSAGLRPDQIDYVSCHATSTKAGDIEEIEAIRQAFGGHAKDLKLNAPKSMLGHLTWSAAVVETIAALMEMKYGVLHPSINIDEIDPAIDLDVCANEARPHRIQYMLKNAFGFGGISSCSIIGRYAE